MSRPPSGSPPVRDDAGGRSRALRTIDWTRLFAPRNAVVLDPPTDVGSPPHTRFLEMLDQLQAIGANVTVVVSTNPAGPRAIDSPRLSDVSGTIDLAVILGQDPLPALEQCVARDVGFAIVLASGFDEIDPTRREQAEARFHDLASRATRVIGPRAGMTILRPWEQGLPGRKLAIATQSGFQGLAIAQGQVLGIGIATWATLGHEADVEWADFVGHFSELDDVGAIATYVEGFKDGRTFMLAADAAARHGIPIVCIKVGRSADGARMAQAHTSHLTGVDAVHDAAFEQFGVIRVDDLDEAIEIAGMFCHAGPTAGTGGVAIYAMSGGTAAHVVDLCGLAGVHVPELHPTTLDALVRRLPAHVTVGNPLDTAGTVTAGPENLELLELIRADPNVDVLFAPITAVYPGMSEELARNLLHLHRSGGKPVVTSWTSPVRDHPSYRALCDAGLPMFHSIGGAVRGLQALVRHRAFVRSYESPFDTLPSAATPSAAAGRPLLAPGGALDEVRSKELLALYGIPTVPEHVATSATEAAAAAGSLGWPVVMKVVSSAIAHKSDLGLVMTDVASESAARRTYRALVERVGDVAPGAAVEGVVVQPMVRGAVAEALLGLSHQPPFGPTVTYGLGGVFAEVFQDVAFGVPPFTRARALAMVESTRGAKLLHGARGRSPGDVAALVDAVLALQTLALELGDDVVELDVNPLMVMPVGQGVIAVDAMVVARVHAS